jgi:Ca2+-binding RTX toxin-like protein
LGDLGLCLTAEGADFDGTAGTKLGGVLMTSPNASGVVGTYSTAGNGQIDPLIWLGFKWGASGAGTPAIVTYSFPTSASKWSNDYALYLDNEPFNGFQAFTAGQQAAAKQAMALWSEVANITFKQVTETATNVGDIRFGNSASVTQDPTAVAWAYTPYEDNDPNVHYPENGDIWFDKQYPFNLQLAPGQEGFWTMLHEIGHAIGLDHPFDDGVPGEPVLAGQDTDQYTVMSYTLELATNAYASTPQLLDILAIQYIYGANMNTRKGNDVYKFSATTEVNRAIWDAGGIDTLDLSNQATGSFISLIDGTHSKFSFHNGQNGPTSSLLGIAFGVTIENAFGGAGNDEIWGNAAANRLTGGNGLDVLEGLDGADRLEGGAGVDTLVGATGTDFLDGGTGDDELHGGSADDTLSGGAGIDLLYGGSGNDLYILDSASDVVEDSGGEEGDGIQASFLIGKFFADIENYKYTGAAAWTFTGDGLGNELSGGSAGDKLDGAGGDDPLLGNGGNDTLTGGLGDDALYGGIGTDKMFGGTGNDTYEINVAADVIDEQGAADSDDLVRSSIAINLASLALGAIEHAVLLGTTALNATGNAQDNKLTGNSGANKLNGGVGADTLNGGNGADTYTVDNLGDQVIETTGGVPGGVDVVVSSVDFELGANLEKLTLTGLALKGTGNELGNTIVGNNGNNVLDGKAGNDTLTGGIGSDTYVVDSVKDVVNETVLNKAGGGVDTVQSSVTFSLATRTNIENLTLTGAGDISGTGNSIANVIEGNAGRNLLDGGAGADTLRGGAGNDTYVVDNINDKVDEGANTDTGDEVKSSLMLGVFAGIENYTYTGTKAWSFTGTTANNKLSGNTLSDTLIGADGDDMLLGNGGNDLLLGEAGNDTLDGGAGIDKMLGGAGNDTYVINALTDIINEEGNADTDDVVRSSVSVNLTSAVFTGIEHIELVGTAANATGNAGNNKITGNAAANLLIGGAGADTMDGGAGNDTYHVTDAGDKTGETTPGAAGGVDLVMSWVDHTLGDNIEKLTLVAGAGSIDGTGNALNNTLTGNEGNNTLDGGAGSDTMAGGTGDDTYIVDTAADVVNEIAAGGGTDTVKSGITFSLAAGANVENLVLTGSAGIAGTGNSLANTIFGNIGDNVLDGLGGGDVLKGGKGNDTYVVDNVGDVVDEEANTDTGDTIKTTLQIAGTLAGIENYSFIGAGAWTFTGDGNANNISGGTLNDTLNGAGGNDTLAGNGGDDRLGGDLGDDWLDGGAGNDTLKGGAGNDTYLLDDTTDVIDEESNADADDLVRVAADVDLSALASGRIEHATLTGTANINALGNAANNKLTGNDGANELNGGIGADTLTGGLGNDTYIVDAGDQVVEAADGGTDLVKSNIDFSLAALAFVENVTLTGTPDIDATGNGLNNVLTGNDGANRLDGGVGNDTMIGGKGDDTYVVDAAGDVVSETIAAGGADLVESGIDFSLAALANVENLTLTGGAQANATGNATNNTLSGNGSDNVLDGAAGADTLKGGAGNDVYVIDTASDVIDEETNTDTGDEVRTSFLLTGAFAGIEKYTYTGFAAWTFTGNGLDNIITGGSGFDTLDGGGGLDTLRGGAGIDVYFIDSADDVVDEQGNAEWGDEVRASFLLASAILGIEAYTYTGTGDWSFSGDSSNNKFTGGSGSDTLAGGAGDDWLDGGAGLDVLKGGSGNDTYVIDNAADTIDEEGNADSFDVVRATISVNLATLGGGAIEHAVLVGKDALNATGNGSNDALTGNDGNNILDGGGGNDVLTGGKGDDTYVLDSAGDVIQETLTNAEGGGIDTVLINFSWYGGDTLNIDNVTITSSVGCSGIGNANDNVVTGNSGDDTLWGLDGADTLIGGAGTDFLYGQGGDDVIIGGVGEDYIEAYLGRNTIDYNHLNEGSDQVHDFSVGTGGDILDLHDVLVDIGYSGSDPFADGYLSFKYDGGFHTTIRVDADGTGGGAATIMCTLSFANLSQFNTDNYII